MKNAVKSLVLFILSVLIGTLAYKLFAEPIVKIVANFIERGFYGWLYGLFLLIFLSYLFIVIAKRLPSIFAQK